MKKKLKLNKKNIIIIFAFFTLFVLGSALIYKAGKYFSNKPILKNKIEKIEPNSFQFLIDFENTKYINNSKSLSTNKALSGIYSSILPSFKAFSSAIQVPIPTNDSSEISNINIRFWINPSTPIINASIVFSIIDQNNNQIHWEGFPIKGENFTADNWYSFYHSFNFPKNLISTRNTIKVYLWNLDSNSNPIYLDDVSISLKESFEKENPRTRTIDFEDYTDKKISSKHSKSGFYSTTAKGIDDFSSTIVIPMKELKYDNMQSISYSFNILSETAEIDAALVVSICDTNNQDVLWHSTLVKQSDFKVNTWQLANGNVIVPPEAINPNNTIKIYIWNRSANEVFVDDIYLVVKENGNLNTEQTPICDLTKDPIFEHKTNSPPYDFKFLKKVNLKEKNYSILNSIFAKNNKILCGIFDPANKNDQIFSYDNKDNFKLISFTNNEIVSKNIIFNPKLNKDVALFADKGFIFAFEMQNKSITQFKLNPKTYTFELLSKITNFDSNKISAISLNSNNSLSVIENNGTISTFIQKDSKYTLSNKKQVAKPQQANLKCIKSNFFISTNEAQLLLIYLENNIDKYVFLDFNTNSNSWESSKLHNNKSAQSYDKFQFLSDYFVCNFDLSMGSKLIMYNRTLRFDLKILDFNKISYNILYNIDFKGFDSNQNPKYYETSKIICGDFIGDSKTEMLIFQDNFNKVDWLTQKVELYTFE